MKKGDATRTAILDRGIELATQIRPRRADHRPARVRPWPLQERPLRALPLKRGPPDPGARRPRSVSSKKSCAPQSGIPAASRAWSPFSTAGSTGRRRPGPGGCLFVARRPSSTIAGAVARTPRRAPERWLTRSRLSSDRGCRAAFREDLEAGPVCARLYSVMLGFHHPRGLLRDPRPRIRARPFGASCRPRGGRAMERDLPARSSRDPRVRVLRIQEYTMTRSSRQPPEKSTDVRLSAFRALSGAQRDRSAVAAKLAMALFRRPPRRGFGKASAGAR